jgi:hypothetical protein
VRRLPAPAVAAFAATIAAVVFAVIAAVATIPIGHWLHLPDANLLGEDHGFDTGDLAIGGAAVGWLCGAAVAGLVVARRRGRSVSAVAVAVGGLIVAAWSTTVVSSAAADWWFALVIFGSPAIALGMAASVEGGSNSDRGDVP